MRISLTILLLWTISLFGGQMVQYGGVNDVNDMVQSGDTLILATNGGIVYYSQSSKTAIGNELGSDRFPDIAMTAICKVADGTIWVGSNKGYLYSRDNRGRWTRYEDFRPRKNSITRIVCYGENYLLIGHNEGISVFDYRKGQAVSTMTEAAAMAAPVGELLVTGDTLFAAIGKSLVRYDSLNTGLTTFSFRTRVHWKPVVTEMYEIKGLIVGTNGVEHFSHRAMQWGDTVVYGTSGQLHRRIGGVHDKTVSLSTDLVSVLRTSSGMLYAATDNRYIRENPFESDSISRYDGVVFGQYQNAALAPNGELWAVGATEVGPNDEAWRGATRFDGKVFSHYSTENANFTGLGQDQWPVALCAARDGSVWLGSNGKCAKMYDPKDGKWYNWIVHSQYNKPDTIYKSVEYVDPGWVKIDAIAQDSMGYMWFSMMDNAGQQFSEYRFVVFDPQSGKQRFLFKRSSGDPLAGKLYDPNRIVVDSRGNRIIISSPSAGANGEFIVIPGSVDPFGSQVEIANVGFTYGNGLFPITQLVSTPNGSVLSASPTGLGLVRADVQSIYKNGIQVDSTNLYDLWIGDYRKPMTSIAIENSSVVQGGTFKNQTVDSVVTTTFWAAITEIGVVRLTLTEYISKGVCYAYMNYVSGERPLTIPVEQFEVTRDSKLALDRNKGILWIASPSGLARYDLGTIPAKGFSDNKDSKIYPNPYSKSGHQYITFDGLSANSFVDIYTLSGKLVAHFDRMNGSGFHPTGSGNLLRWTPASTIAPGTYMVALKDSEEKGMTELQKIVIIP